MRPTRLPILCLLAAAAFAQDVIPLYPGPAPGGPSESYAEKRFFSKAWNTEVVTNVSTPTLTVFQSVSGRGAGAAVVICPGGGFMALSINSEGFDVAKWLAARGMTAFVLKYRLARTGEDATTEFSALYADKQKFAEKVGPVIPMAIADGIAAVALVRKRAKEWGISPDRVGIIGFSAGGTVAAGTGFRYTEASRPAFVAPIYAAASGMKDLPVPSDAPPLFAAAATDDQLNLAMDSVALYSQWKAAGKPAELHMFARGGHGFGMRQQGLPSDRWIDRFAEWLQMQGWLAK